MSTLNSVVKNILQNIFFCVQKKKETYSFETSGGWLNDDRIVIFGWIIFLSTLIFYKCVCKPVQLIVGCCFLVF